MARTSNKVTKIGDVKMNQVALSGADAAAQELATQLAANDKRVAIVASQLAYELPYNRERVTQEARFYMGQSAEAMLEAGKRLILLKENEPHGEFITVVEEQLGLASRTAQVMMQAAVRYLMNPALASKAQTFALLGKSKLFELMVEGDDDLIALAEGGTIAGLNLDAVDRMSVRELKVALREERAEHKATNDVLDDTTEKYKKLQTQQARIKPPTPDDTGVKLRGEISRYALEAEGLVRGSLRDGFIALRDHAEENGGNHDEYMAGILAQLERCIAEVRGELEIKAVADGNPLPEWMRGVAGATLATAAAE